MLQSRLFYDGVYTNCTPYIYVKENNSTLSRMTNLYPFVYRVANATIDIVT